MTNWETCVQFHGHACGGLTIGYKAACYAAELLELSFSGDEQVVCIAENDACGVDAIQALLGCSIGKGNLLFHMRGKQAFSFYNRATGKSVRLVLRPRPEGMTREESFAYCPPRSSSKSILGRVFFVYSSYAVRQAASITPPVVPKITPAPVDSPNGRSKSLSGSSAKFMFA